jgi:hypothetical protein
MALSKIIALHKFAPQRPQSAQATSRPDRNQLFFNDMSLA